MHRVNLVSNTTISLTSSSLRIKMTGHIFSVVYTNYDRPFSVHAIEYKDQILKVIYSYDC